MDFALSPEQEALQTLAREILTDHATAERLKACEADPEWIDRALWAALAKANLLGVAIPEAVGGTGLGLVELCLLLEEVGRAVAPVPAWATLVLGAAPIAEYGSSAQRERWLRPVTTGEGFLSAALGEAPADDPTRPETQARRVSGGWELSGTKTCVPAAHLAARVLVPARTRPDRLGVFLVDPRGAGVALGQGVATHREPQFQLTLRGTRVDDADVLGGPEDGAAIVEWLVQRAIVGLCAMELGIADQALHLTARYTSERKQFDRPIASFQAVQQRAADAYIDVEAIRLTLWQAVWRLEAGRLAAAEVAVAKFWAAEGGHRVVYAAQHLHGGMGMDVDYPVHRYYLWSKAIELTLGGASRQLERLGATIAAGGIEA